MASPTRTPDGDKDLKALYFAVSHELRAPLRHIEGYAELLLMKARQGQPAPADAERVLHAARRLDEMLERLLDLLELSRRPIEPSPVDLSAAAEGRLALLRQGEPGRRVETRVEPGLRAQADPELARMLLESLLTNAWKATARATPARIDVRRDGDGFVVEDNGLGFEPSRAGGLFSPFRRLHSQTEFPGLGCGLAIAKRIVERHGGRIEARARPGGGAAFHFTLP